MQAIPQRSIPGTGQLRYSWHRARRPAPRRSDVERAKSIVTSRRRRLRCGASQFDCGFERAASARSRQVSESALACPCWRRRGASPRMHGSCGSVADSSSTRSPGCIGTPTAARRCSRRSRPTCWPRAEIHDARKRTVWHDGRRSTVEAGTRVRPRSAAAMVLLVPAVLVAHRPLRTIQLGDNTVKGLGVPVVRTQAHWCWSVSPSPRLPRRRPLPVALVAFVAAPSARRLVNAPLLHVPPLDGLKLEASAPTATRQRPRYVSAIPRHRATSLTWINVADTKGLEAGNHY